VHIHFIKNIQNKILENKKQSCNPASLLQAQSLLDYIEPLIPPCPFPLSCKRIIGMGDSMCLSNLVLLISKKFNLPLLSPTSFTQQQAYQCLLAMLHREDQQLQDIPQGYFAVPKLCLLVAVMKKLEID
jgi:hypothetical protein